MHVKYLICIIYAKSLSFDNLSTVCCMRMKLTPRVALEPPSISGGAQAKVKDKSAPCAVTIHAKSGGRECRRDLPFENRLVLFMVVTTFSYFLETFALISP